MLYCTCDNPVTYPPIDEHFNFETTLLLAILLTILYKSNDPNILGVTELQRG